jgi:hypothetical protein
MDRFLHLFGISQGKAEEVWSNQIKDTPHTPQAEFVNDTLLI